MREAVILGAGVIGVTSAYALASRGFAVTVIDAASAVAEGGASYRNGGQLSYSYTDALASPSLLKNIPGYLLGYDPALRLKPGVSPAFWDWTVRFLANAGQGAFERNTIDTLKIGLDSRKGFDELSGKIDFNHRRPGKINLYSSYEALERAKDLSRLKNRHGAGQSILSPEEAIAKEPALAHYGHSFIGALWSPLDEAGDSHLFCRNLQRLLETDYGVKFQFDTKVERLKKRAGKIDAVVTQAGELPSSLVIIALGAWSAPIAKTIGVHLPIWPMQGYSMTVPAAARAPTASITDTSRKVVFCRIGDKLRIAGLADIGSRHPGFRQDRFRTLVEMAKGIFPKAGDYDGDLEAWTSYRPMTPTSQPIVGATKIGGLFVNSGHGSLGWTLSMATAARLAACVEAAHGG